MFLVIFLCVIFLIFFMTDLLYYIYENSRDLYWRSGEYNHKVVNEFPKIKFKTFHTLYNTNPDVWLLKEVYVRYGSDDRAKSNDPTFRFNFIDYNKYILFKIFIKNSNKKLLAVKETARLIELVKKDILENEKKAEKKYSEYRDILNKLKQ